jgi:hypothetical protein
MIRNAPASEDYKPIVTKLLAIEREGAVATGAYIRQKKGRLIGDPRYCLRSESVMMPVLFPKEQAPISRPPSPQTRCEVGVTFYQ